MQRLFRFRPVVIALMLVSRAAVGQSTKSGSAEGALPLATDGKANYVIHVGSAEDPVVFHAAEELATYLGRITGADFAPLSFDADPIAGRPLIVVGRNNALIGKLAPGLPYESLGEEGFIIRNVGPNLFITGAQRRGTLYGVYWLLDHKLGVKWFSPEYTYVPRKPSAALERLDERQAPRFVYREIFNKDTDDAQWRQHNLLNGDSHHRWSKTDPEHLNTWSQYWPEGGHNFHTIVRHKKYGQEHPEWFPDRQLALMSDEVRRAATDYLVEKISNRRDRAWTFSQEDRSWSPDPASRVFADAHGGALSAPVLDMVMDVAARVREAVPDARIGAEAYQWSFDPPAGMTVPDYVVMTVTPIEADFGYPYNSQANRRFADGIEGWTRLSNQIVIWDHITNFGSYLLPFPEIYPMAENLQWMARFPQIKGYFAEGSYGTLGAEFAELRAWVGGRLLWNPDQDARAVVAQFLEGYYGDAAPYLQQYLDLMHESVRKTGSKLTIRTPVTSPYLSFETMRRADELFDQAEAAVVNAPGFDRRVKTARIGPDYVILLRRADYKAAAEKAGVSWEPRTEQRLARFSANTTAAGVGRYGEAIGGVNALMDALRVERRVAPAPEFVKDQSPSDWADYQDLDVRLYAGQVVSDTLASDGGALRMPGASGVWGVQMPLDNLPADGQWKLRARVRIDPAAGADPDAIAFSFGVHPDSTCAVKVSQVVDDQYRWIEPPGAYRHDSGKAMWFAPPKSDAIEALYIDRIVAVRQK